MFALCRCCIVDRLKREYLIFHTTVCVCLCTYAEFYMDNISQQIE